VLDQLESAGVSTVWMGGWGEPLVHPRFEEAVELARGRFRLGLITNGTLLADHARKVAGAFDWVVVSVDSFDPDLYSRLRVGSSIEDVEEGMLRLAEAARARGRPVSLWVSVIAMRSNLEEIPDMVARASELGASGMIVSNLIPTGPGMVGEVLYGRAPHDSVGRVMHRARLRAVVANLRLVEPDFQYRTDRYCPFVNSRSLAVSWDGEVAPCLFVLHTYRAWIDGREKLVKRVSFGSLRESDLMDVWSSGEYVAFRARVRLAQFPSCNDCPYEEFCDFFSTNEVDCWGASPSCAACPYYRRVVLCPSRRLVEHVRMVGRVRAPART